MPSWYAEFSRREDVRQSVKTHTVSHFAGCNLVEPRAAPFSSIAMLRPYRGRRPTLSESAYVDASAQVIGDVELGDRVSVWCNTTIRGDVNSIRIGNESNIQDNSCLHVDRDKPLIIGQRVVVGHSVTLHACVIGDKCLIGMGSTVLSGSKIGAGSIVAAGAVVVEGAEFPPGSLLMGAPAKVLRPVSDSERERIRRNAASYIELIREYKEEPQ